MLLSREAWSWGKVPDRQLHRWSTGSSVHLHPASNPRPAGMTFKKKKREVCCGLFWCGVLLLLLFSFPQKKSTFPFSSVKYNDSYLVRVN